MPFNSSKLPGLSSALPPLADTLKSPFSSPTAPEAPAATEVPPAPSLADTLKAPAPSPSSSLDFSNLDKLEKEREKAADNRQVNSVDDIIQKQTAATNAAVSNLQKDPNYTGYKATVDNLNNQIKSTRGLMNDKESQVGWLSAMERIGQALTQYAAASYGLEKGVNLAGLKMDKTDWEKVLDRSQERLQNEIKGLQDLRSEAVKKMGGMEENAEQAGKFAVGEQLRESEQKQKVRDDILNDKVNTEKFKIAQEAAQENKQAMLDFKRSVAGAKTNNKELDKSQAYGIQVLNNKVNTAKQQMKSLQSALANGSLMESALNSKSEDQAKAKLVSALTNAGVDLESAQAEVSTWFGFGKKKKEFTPELVKQAAEKAINEKKSIINNAYSWSKKIHSAGSADELESTMNQLMGGVSKPADTAKSGTTPEVIKMKSPDGKIYGITSDRVNEYKNAGYTEEK